MKKFLPILLLLTSCASKKIIPETRAMCALVFNLESSTFETIVNQERCEDRFMPASTFKVPLAVMAFDANIIRDKDTPFKWDGVTRKLESWNRNQTVESWMRDSVVWVSQELTPKLGVDKIENYLKNFEYGNADMTGGVKDAWLTPKDSLKVSAYEQLHFMKKLWRGELPVTKASQRQTIDVLPSELSPNGQTLLGKTGSGSIGAQKDLTLGWYVGYVKAGEKNYIVVVNFNNLEKQDDPVFAGPLAKEMAKQILRDKKLW